jgi:hypothetical protein
LLTNFGINAVQEHQNNHLRILELRQASAALDTQIRETLTSLANTRKDIVNTPTTTFPSKPNYPIAYEELLSYARRISKTTMPPAATIQQANASMFASGAQTPNPESQSQAVTPAAGMTPAAVTPSQTQSPAGINGTISQQQGQTEQQPPSQQGGGGASLLTSLPEGMTQYLNPLSGQVFFPWPQEDKIRSGALAANQLLVEQGIDPRGYDPVAEEERKQKEAAERKEREEQEAREREERERQLHEEREKARRERERQREKEQEEWRRASLAAGVPGDVGGQSRPSGGAPEKKQFQFTNLDDLDDDDEDED